MINITFERIRDAIYYARERNVNDLTIYMRQSDIERFAGKTFTSLVFMGQELRSAEEMRPTVSILGCDVAPISEKANHDWLFIVGSQSTFWTLCIGRDGALIEKPYGLNS